MRPAQTIGAYDIFVSENFFNNNKSDTIKAVYYLKIAYGYDWMEKYEDGMTHGKFTRNRYYEKVGMSSILARKILNILLIIF